MLPPSSYFWCSHRNHEREKTLTFGANYCEGLADESFVLSQSGQILYLRIKA